MEEARSRGEIAHGGRRRQQGARPHLGIARTVFAQHVLAASASALGVRAGTAAVVPASGFDLTDGIWDAYTRLCRNVARAERRARLVLAPTGLAVRQYRHADPTVAAAVRHVAESELRLAARKRIAYEREMRRVRTAREDAAAARQALAMAFPGGEPEPLAAWEQPGEVPSWEFYGPVRPLEDTELRSLTVRAGASIGVLDHIAVRPRGPEEAGSADALVDELRTCLCVPTIDAQPCGHGTLCPFGGK